MSEVWQAIVAESKGCASKPAERCGGEGVETMKMPEVIEDEWERIERIEAEVEGELYGK